MRIPRINFIRSDHEEKKEKPKIYCNTCGIRLSTGLFGNRAIEYQDGSYCDACHFQKIKDQREEQKKKEAIENDNTTES